MATTTREQVDRLIAEVAPLAEAMEAAGYGGEDVWTIAADPETLLVVDLDPDRNCLTLSAEVAPLPRGDRLRLYGTLLEYNGQWLETGGTRLALDGPEGAVVLLVEIGAAGLDATTLAAFLAGFLRRVRAWREVLARWEDRGAGEAGRRHGEAAFDPLAAMGAVRA